MILKKNLLIIFTIVQFINYIYLPNVRKVINNLKNYNILKMILIISIIFRNY